MHHNGYRRQPLTQAPDGERLFSHSHTHTLTHTGRKKRYVPYAGARQEGRCACRAAVAVAVAVAVAILSYASPLHERHFIPKLAASNGRIQFSIAEKRVSQTLLRVRRVLYTILYTTVYTDVCGAQAAMAVSCRQVWLATWFTVRSSVQLTGQFVQ